MFNDEITVFHLNDDNITYTKQYFDNLYFEHSKKINVIDKGIENASTGLIIIPTEKEINIFEMDVVVEGKINKELNGEYRLSDLKKDYHTYIAVSVDDMRKGGLPHYEVGVK